MKSYFRLKPIHPFRHLWQSFLFSVPAGTTIWVLWGLVSGPSLLSALEPMIYILWFAFFGGLFLTLAYTLILQLALLLDVAGPASVALFVLIPCSFAAFGLLPFKAALGILAFPVAAATFFLIRSYGEVEVQQ